MRTSEIEDGADTFSTSAERVIAYLKAHTPIPEWSVSRVAGGEQVHVHTGDNESLTLGRRVPWDDTFCIRMSNGADRVVADASTHPDYRDHPDAGPIRAYAGIPITDDDGRTFGTLCGVGPQPLSASDDVDTDLIELMADLLSSQLHLARIADRERRSADLASALAQTDALTGLINRRGWDLLVDDADRRISAYGDPVAIAVVDLDGLKSLNDQLGHDAGDDLLRRAGSALAEAAEPSDRVARYGGDEFAILSNNVAVKNLATHFAAFTDALAEQGVAGSMGYAPTSAGVADVATAFAQADTEMYADKEARRALGSSATV
ncbi:MAG: sensor domain-containing diguanylate cyclase [Aeromicrobium sp.]